MRRYGVQVLNRSFKIVRWLIYRYRGYRICTRIAESAISNLGICALSLPLLLRTNSAMH